MKIEKYYLCLMVVIGILCVPHFGQVEPASPTQRGELPPKESEPLLLGQPEPALKGIRQLYIVVLAPDAEPGSHGLVIEELEKSVIDKLKEADITIAEPDIDKMEPNSAPVKIVRRKTEPANVKNLKYRHPRIPELRVDVDVLDIRDSQQVVFRVQLSLARLVYLGRESRLSFKTDVWQSESTMQAVSAESMAAAVNGAVLEQVEAFIHAYLAANPPHKRPSDANDIGEAAKEQVEPAAESTPASQRGEPAEYEYVASKNSEVFHKPQCIWAKRIKPENLVYYGSRDEAINAGKRPCERCNP
jgi:hypothetical protein